MLTGLTISLIGLVGWTATLPALTYSWQIPGMILTGFGLGLTISPTMTDGLSRVDAAQRGQASGLIQTVRQLGGTFGVAIIGAVILGRTAGAGIFRSRPVRRRGDRSDSALPQRFSLSP